MVQSLAEQGAGDEAFIRFGYYALRWTWWKLFLVTVLAPMGKDRIGINWASDRDLRQACNDPFGSMQVLTTNYLGMQR